MILLCVYSVTLYAAYCPALGEENTELVCLYCACRFVAVIIYFFFYFSPPISDFDVFNEGKTQSFFESQQAVMTLCTYLEDIHKNMEKFSKNQLFEQFNKLLQVSVLYTNLSCMMWPKK